MTLRYWRDNGPFLAAALAVAASAPVLVYLMYAQSPAAALVLPIGLAAVVMVCRRPIWGVHFALLTIPLEVIHVRFGIRSITFAENVLLLTAVASAAHLLFASVERTSAPHRAFALLTVVAATGLLFAEDTAVVFRITRVWLAYLIISVYVSRQPREQLRRVLESLAVSAGIVGLTALATTGPQELIGTGELATGRAETGFAHPNVLAFYLLLGLPPALVLLVRNRGWRRIPMAVATVGIIGGIMLTLSRGGIIGASAALAILLVWPQFRRIAIGLLAVIAVFVALNFHAVVTSPEITTVSRRLETLRSARTDPRIEIYRQTPAIILSHPLLGVGEGNFAVVSPRYGLLDPANDLAYDHAHDIFLTIAAELGFVGLAVFLWFLGAAVRVAVRDVRARGPDWHLALAASASLGGLLVTSLAEYPPRTNLIMATILVLVGVLVGFERASTAEPPAVV